MPPQYGRQAAEIVGPLTSDSLKKSVTGSRRGHWTTSEGSLHTKDGQRKYLNEWERKRALLAMQSLPKKRELYARVLAYSGARPSEVLNLTARSFDVDARTVTIVTLKRRKLSVREVPIPDQLMADLENYFSLRDVQADDEAGLRCLWNFCRMTAWRIIKAVMRVARIAGPQACPKGFRHAFGHAHCRSTTPLHVIQYWMGHARLSTTAIYMTLASSEAREFAQRLWDKELALCA